MPDRTEMDLRIPCVPDSSSKSSFSSDISSDPYRLEDGEFSRSSQRPIKSLPEQDIQCYEAYGHGLVFLSFTLTYQFRDNSNDKGPVIRTKRFRILLNIFYLRRRCILFNDIPECVQYASISKQDFEITADSVDYGNSRLFHLGRHFSLRYTPIAAGRVVTPAREIELLVDKSDSSSDSSSLTTDTDSNFSYSSGGDESPSNTLLTLLFNETEEIKPGRIHQQDRFSTAARANPGEDMAQSDSSSQGDSVPSLSKEKVRKSKAIRQNLNKDKERESEKRQPVCQQRKCFTRTECAALQSKVLQFSRSNNLEIYISFDLTRVTIEYVETADFTDQRLHETFRELLDLNYDQINLLRLSHDEPLIRTSGVPGSSISLTTGSTIGAFVNVRSMFTPDRPKLYALVCGHDKNERLEVMYGEQFRDKLGKVEHVISRDMDEEKCSTDAALVRLATDSITPYITFKRRIRGRRGRCTVHVYIKGYVDISKMTLRKILKKYKYVNLYRSGSSPMWGEIVGYPSTYGGTKYNRPLYQAIKIQAIGTTKAIHGPGDSGMLITTAFRRKAVRDFQGHVVMYVKVIGMLVASTSRFSMALPIDQTISGLRNYMGERNNLNVPIHNISFVCPDRLASVTLSSSLVPSEAIWIGQQFNGDLVPDEE